MMVLGFSPEEAADQLGLPRRVVHGQLNALRAELEQAAGIRREATVIEERRDRVVAARRAGEAATVIARREGVSPSIVLADLRARDEPRR